MNIIQEAEDILERVQSQHIQGKEEDCGYLWDHKLQRWSDARVTHRAVGSGHVFRIYVNGKRMLEQRGSEYGMTLASLLEQWEANVEKEEN